MIISPKLMNYVMIPYKWKRFIFPVGRARDQYSIEEVGLMAGGKERKEGRQTIFFTPLDPFNSDADEAESITDNNKPRQVQYQIHWRPEQDAWHWIHLSKAQDAGLEFWQTGSNTIITYQSVPKECVVEGCQRKWKERNARKTAHTSRRTKKFHSEHHGFMRDPKICASLGKPRASCRRGALTQLHQGVAIGRKRTSNSLLISESTGIPNDETCKDEQSMQRIAEQVRKLFKYGKNFKRRLT